MKTNKVIIGKRILIVDDEKDVLDSLQELLDKCQIDTATNYEKAIEMIDSNSYDLAILDIAGVSGYKLLEKANEKKLPAIMLTANRLSEENLMKSAEKGAVYYAPKEEMINIEAIVTEVIDALENQKSTWERMFTRLARYYDKQFNGPEWREKLTKSLEKSIHRGY